MIDIQGIEKSFGSLQVLKGINLHINKGDIVSIVGPSGAGKTTLLQIMGTLDKPDRGNVVINGTETGLLNSKKLSEFRNRELGFVFQFHQLLPEFTAIENIKEFNYRVDKLMVNFGQTVLREGMDYTINKLTGGIDLINGFELSTDDILQFVVVKQKEF